MITGTRRWLRRNRTNFAIGAGVLGAGYMAGQYVLGKISEARQRMSDERIAKENLRRRFEQNQEDCTFTVLAILPTATDNLMHAIPVEQILDELQKSKAERLARSVGPSEIASSAPPSVADDDGKSLASFQSEGYVHASQIAGLDAETGSGSGSGSLEASEVGAKKEEEKRNKKTKAQLWNEMKISSITRAFTLLYTLSLLSLLTRIQLNLLGRRNYLASVVSLASPPAAGSKINLENHDDDNFDQAYGNDFETNRRYLSLSWWLLHRGCIDLMHKVRGAVKEVFGSLNPREEITLEKLSELTLEVRKRVEGATEEERRTNKWLPYLLPPPDQEAFVLQESGMTSSDSPSSPTTTSSIRRLIDETSDLIDSPSFTHVLTLLLDAAFSHLIDVKISALAYKIPPISESSARVQEIVGSGEVKAKVASSLAVFCREASKIGAGSNNEYAEKVESVRGLEAFAAVVYSSHFEFESPEAVAVSAALVPLESAVEEQKEGVSTTLGAEQILGPGVEKGEGEGGVEAEETGLESAWTKALKKEDGIA